MATHFLLVAIRTECRNNICRDNNNIHCERDIMLQHAIMNISN